ncbi:MULTISPECIES: DUF3685 domain-containing protein [unclassified Leptolyngbya]|uniref:DUF3685 domain-containing protein n=1 Tax=unclassified Leptolyngbya TaxID=2650499 RepID=UPI001682CFC9|nr:MULTISPECIES: DUF3685 domain-containing protein [unclassified Leptolyngbya]MBD1913137.1 DUF3685 domain-containing protein [Leptolyngbya sp. FACHB-8]MBD2157833.1 DUF3685 domain-containing protein [Leptolyngbya sp. FACHB-16]
MPPIPSLLYLVLLDDDPTYRAGMRLWLEQFGDIQVIADGGLGLEEAIATVLSLPPASDVAGQPAPLIVLGLPGSAHGFALCQQLRAQFPQVPILVLGTSAEPVLVAATRRTGATGFWLRDSDPETLVATIRQVAAGQAVWIEMAPAAAPLTTPGPLRRLRRNWRMLGTQQIDRAIADLDKQLRDRRLTSLDRLVLEGRRRELNASRWLVQRILATPTLSAEEPVRDTSTEPVASSLMVPQTMPVPALAATAPVETLETRMSAQSLRSLLINAVLRRLGTSVENQTHTPMETDILRAERKQELFILILRKLEDILDELNFSQVSIEHLPEKRSQLLRDLWEATIIDFLGKYYTLTTAQGELELVGELLDEADTVQAEILDPIPGFETLITHLLFQTPLIIDGLPYAAGNPEALIRAEMLLSHLVIQVANGVMQPLLNRFSDLEVMKQNFYNRRLISTREIERFRNDLSWHYRRNRYFIEPQDIFESRYRLLTFQFSGIQYRSIYAPRREELDQLNGIPYFVTLALETRDAIAPRLRSAFSVVGSSLVYVLTEVIGRGIGLVGRGVIKGVGNVWQDQRYPRNGERPR